MYKYSFVGYVPGDIEKGVATNHVSIYEMTVRMSVYKSPVYGKNLKITGYKWKLNLNAISFVSMAPGKVTPTVTSVLQVNGEPLGVLTLTDQGGLAPRDHQYSYVGEATWDLPYPVEDVNIYFQGGWTVDLNGLPWTPNNGSPIGPPIFFSAKYDVNK